MTCKGCLPSNRVTRFRLLLIIHVNTERDCIHAAIIDIFECNIPVSVWTLSVNMSNNETAYFYHQLLLHMIKNLPDTMYMYMYIDVSLLVYYETFFQTVKLR
jgi:hypothetical protein